MQRQFVIHHYAGSVTYDCEGFVDSNKDTLFKDLIQMIQLSTKYVYLIHNEPAVTDHSAFAVRSL